MAVKLFRARIVLIKKVAVVVTSSPIVIVVLEGAAVTVSRGDSDLEASKQAWF